ncbi:endonuclease domain-containing protein [Sphingomonas soli]|uniref:endonuclease domain-containing protein n=1 Tax=Sphingomonas soli TaxID=266127 RepID=UPI000A9B870A|nr:endonuclease domain-containing protein [Sphingomonas soli]
MRGYDDLTLKRAKAMRKAPTESERVLWTHLRGGRLNGAKFRRQQPIGPYIVDFICQEHRLIVEADGSQHLDNDHDARRDAFLTEKGCRVFRVWNNAVLDDIEAVKTAIWAAISSPHPPKPLAWAPPSPSRGEGHKKDAFLA